MSCVLVASVIFPARCHLTTGAALRGTSVKLSTECVHSEDHGERVDHPHIAFLPPSTNKDGACLPPKAQVEILTSIPCDSSTEPRCSAI